MDPHSRIYVAGAGTMIGRALTRRLADARFGAVIEGPEPDLGDRAAVERFFAKTQPEYVVVAAGKTAGIGGNTARPADLMIDNLLVAGHLIPAASRHRVKKLLYLASSCAYPKEAPHPLRTASLWTGPVEPTSAAYAVAKLAGVVLCQAYRKQYGAPFVAGIAGDAYGPHDDFRPDESHVVAALMRRIDEAKSAGRPSVDVWGSGTPRREFIYVDDLADACLFVIQRYDGAEPINLGVGRDESIGELAAAIRDVVGYDGELRFDRTRPDGMPYKGLDSSALARLGWTPSWTLRRGLEETYRWYLSEVKGQPA
jgi:GDP-L-fucose synthase